MVSSMSQVSNKSGVGGVITEALGILFSHCYQLVSGRMLPRYVHCYQAITCYYVRDVHGI